MTDILVKVRLCLYNTFSFFELQTHKINHHLAAALVLNMKRKSVCEQVAAGPL